MSVRIPGPVNRALDGAHRHPRAVAAVIVAAAGTGGLAFYWASPVAATIAAALLLLYVISAFFTVRELQLRETIRQLRYDLAAERRENERLRAGDPSAPTAQLRSIGDRGEPT